MQNQVLRNIVGLLLILGLISCGTKRSSVVLEQPGAAADVDLLEKGTAIAAADIIATFGSELKTSGFRDKIYSRIKSTFSGLQIKSKQDPEGKFAFDGNLQAFWAKYFQHELSQTYEWPREQFKDEVYDDVRAASLEVKLLQGGNREQLRVYYVPTRIGYDNNQYKHEDTLLIGYIEPSNGVKTFVTLRNGSLYRLQNGGKYPTKFEEASLISNVEAGSFKVGDVEGTKPGEVEHDIIFPTNFYAVKTFLPLNETAASPLGEAIKESPACFENLLNAFIKNQTLAEVDFLSGLEIMQRVAAITK